MVELVLEMFASAVVRRYRAAGVGGFGGVETARHEESTGLSERLGSTGEGNGGEASGAN